MRVAIIGAGAVGKVLAAYASCENTAVSLVCRSESKAMAINGRGIHISGIRGEKHKFPNAVSNISDLNARSKFDCIIFATKTYDLRSAAAEALPYLAKDGIAVSVQNGICTEILSDVIGKRRTVSAVLTFTCTDVNETCAKLTSEGSIYIGRADKKIDESIVWLRAFLGAAFPTTVSDNIYDELYSKLALTSAISAASIISGRSFSKISKDKYARKFCNGILAEYAALAEHTDFSLMPFDKHSKEELLPPPDSALSKIRNTLLWIKWGSALKNADSPSFVAFQNKKRTEIYYLNGWIVRRAERYGLSIPMNLAAFKMISEIEKGKLTPARENLKALFKEKK